MMKYIKGKLGFKLTLRSDNLSMIKWWVDVSFAMHTNFQGNTGDMMPLGSGAITSGLRKQKINIRSSTNNEIIGVNDMMGSVLCTIYFIRGQGYIMFQDNHITMCLILNGKK